MSRLFGSSPQLSVLSGSVPNAVLKELGWLGGDKLTELSIDDSSGASSNAYTDATLDFICQACPNLLRLSVHERYPNLSDVSIETIVTHCPKLESLTINWERITDTSMDDLATISTLKNLNLSWCDSVTPVAIIRVLKANRGLESLAITAYEVIDDSILRCISEHLLNLRELTLDVGEVSGDSTIIAITINCPQLEKFEIENLFFGDSLLLSLSQHCSKLRHLLVGWLYVEADAEAQVEEQSMVTEAALIQLFQGCPDLRTLEYLPRSATDISLHALAVHCPQLEMIGISYNTHITDSGLCDMFKPCRHLSTIQVQYCPNVTDESLFTLARYCPEVRILTLDCPKLTETSLLYLAAHSHKLQELTVRRMSLSDDILSIIARRCKNLKSINLASCTGVTTVGVLSLINKCRRLKRVFIYE